jgi:hypothetical protein
VTTTLQVSHPSRVKVWMDSMTWILELDGI